ncbi:sickle tail protein homolog isoform X8 [Centroberyx affinis]|uniref:sickle tail protein homolog isoform X8 n=1 Tax=Centroberyx affinis TaxID=166261 RepID=UPI003A5BD248
MSRASRLARPPSAGAGSKLPSPRKECPGTAAAGGRARVLSVGEKLMRAGSDGILTRQKSLAAAVPVPQDKAQSETQTEAQAPSQSRSPGENQGQNMETVPPKSRISPPKASGHQQSTVQKQTKSNLKVTSPEDVQHLSRRQASPNGTAPSRGDAKASRTVPRRHTVGGARSSREILAMQPSDMDKKREAFLEHLKQKYPHHASAIMGHQERLREQSRSPKHGPSSQPGVGDQVDHLSLASLESLDTMSEADAPTAFTRGSRVRASLPVVRSTNQTKDRSLGVLYLQYGDETKQIRMPNEITSTDTVRALFVSAFPQQLTMKMLESPSVAVYVKDDMRNMYYELTDVRNITDHSCLKVYHKDPAQAFSHGPRPANGDARMHREMIYASRDGQHPLRQPPMGPPPHHPMQGSMSPPTPHSMPPSPSRIPFGPRQGSIPGSATIPRDRLSNANPPARSVSPCPSAILERRDVKPDEDMGGKSHSLARGNEGLYADPYLLQEGRISLATAHGAHPAPGLDGPDHGLGGYHRASIRSTGSYSGPSPTDSMDHPSLYRQKSRNSQLPTLGSKTPPPSPHRMAEVRMIDIHGGPPHGGPPHGGSPHGVPPHGVPPHGVPPHGVPPHGVPLERSSPVRQSFRKEEVAGTKPRNNMASPVVSDLQGQLQGPVPAASDPQTRERMKAMEQQIASLTGLVQHALLKGPNTSGTKEPPSERPPKTSSPAHSAHSAGGSPVLAPKSSAAPSEKGSVPLKVNLLQFRKNVSDLRLQLHQMRQLQLQNQEALRVQLKRAEQEISVKLAEAMRRLEDPVHRQRALVEEDRHKYLGLEERVLTQLGELEQYVDCLKRDSVATHRVVTLKDVEEGAVNLRKVGESLAGLKGEFPALQTRMRAVLRVEVEAVKFLKEEPHKLDSMLKRVKSLTETLSSLRRCATEGLQKGSDPSAVSAPVDNSPAAAAEAPAEAPPASAPPASAPPASAPPGSPSAMPEPQSSTIRSEAAEKEWEEKRQNMGHYDGKEFEKILQEAQANMMKGIPSLEVEENPALPPAATGDQADGHSPMESPTEEPQSEPDSDKPAKQGPEKLPKPVMEKPAKPALERPSKAGIERPSATKPAPTDKVTKLGSEKASKSPPPPPPRKTYPSSSSGMTTTRSGEVVYTSRKESVSAQEGEEEAPPPAPQPKPTKVPPETKPKSASPPPVTASAVRDEEDEGDKIMAELQVFQKCTVKDVGVKNLVEPTTRIEPQIRELRPGGLLPLKETKQSSEPSREDKDPDTDENGNTTVRQSPGVIYYVTGQISKEHPPPSGVEETPERREPTLPPSQVSNVNVNDNSPSQQQQQQPLSEPPVSPPPITPPPISPKPVGLNGFKLPKKQVKRSASLKTSAEVEKGNIILNQINTEKKLKSSVIQEQISSSKSIIPEPVATSTTSTTREGPKSDVAPPEKAPSEDSDLPRAEGDEEASLSPDLPGEEAPPPPDNIAFMITNTKVQALSCGEYQELVSAKKGSVQTVTVGGAGNRGNSTGNSATDPTMPQDNGFNKKPVIIIFDEPMDIRSAYKRLSTIFECEEELERMLAEERIDEESEESDMERSSGQVKVEGPDVGDGRAKKVSGGLGSSQMTADRTSLSSSSSSSISELTEGGVNSESTGDTKQDGKKKFKFKFPKKQLAALSQALRTGTKSGKKTLQVVVYEDEEESDGTVRQHKEAKRFEIVRSKSLADTPKAPGGSVLVKRENSDSLCRTDEIRKSTYKTLDSLEQTIKQLETTISEMGPRSPEEPARVEEAKGGNGKSSEGVGLKRSSSLPSSKGSGPKVSLPSKSSLRKKTKPQLLPRPVVIPTTTTTAPSAPSTVQQNASVASPTSRMPVPLSAKSRQSPGTTDKAGKQQKLQDAQRQFRQANGSAKRVGGDHKTTSPTAPTSKIPAFYPSSTKGSSQSAQNSDATNPTNPSSPPSSSSSSMTKSSIPSPHTPRSGSVHSSHIPSLSNGSLKLPTPSQHTGKALSFSSQTQNGRAHSSSSSSSFSSSSSSSPSPLSPTPLGPGGKSIRTIHTPSFTSYRPHNGSSGKSCIPTATAAKDTT